MSNDFTKHEVDFLTNELEAQKNEQGVFLYRSADGESVLSLEFVLRHYRDWMVENRILKEFE